MNFFVTVMTLVFLMGTVLGRRYCPKKDNKQYYVRNNKCCSDKNCVGGKICCDENYGNTCHKPVGRPQGGIRVNKDSWECELDTVTADYCPPKSGIVCVRSINECCSDDDCCLGELCCQENCGNQCHPLIKTKTNGTRVRYYPDCSIDESFNGGNN